MPLAFRPYGKGATFNLVSVCSHENINTSRISLTIGNKLSERSNFL